MSWEEQFAQPVLVEKMMLGWVQRRPRPQPELRHASDRSTRRSCSTPATWARRRPAATPPSRSASPTARTTTSSTGGSSPRRSRTRTCRPTAPSSAPTACPASEPSDRRNILRIRDDSDTDKAEFQTQRRLRGTGHVGPQYPNDFKMKVLETAADFARVHITYGDASRTRRSGRGRRAPTGRAPTSGDERPQPGRHAASATSRGRGTTTASSPPSATRASSTPTAVRVDFFVKDFTLGGGAETALGHRHARRRLRRRGRVHLVRGRGCRRRCRPIPFLNIRPHYCVVARIAEYPDPADPPSGRSPSTTTRPSPTTRS